MKKVACALMLAVALASLNLTYAADTKPSVSVKKWEYKVVDKSEVFARYHKAVKEKKTDASNVLEKMLNELGEQGWELVGDSMGQSWIFKRPKANPPAGR